MNAPRNWSRLLRENEQLRRELDEARDALRAIRSGEVDALLISTTAGDQVFTLEGADSPYRLAIEQVSEGVVTLERNGVISYGNRSFSALVARPLSKLPGMQVRDFIVPQMVAEFDRVLADGSGRCEVGLVGGDGSAIPVYASLSEMKINNLVTCCAVFTDLREQKRREYEIADRSLIQSILAQAHQAIVVLDASGRIKYASKSADAFGGREITAGSFDEVFGRIHCHGRPLSLDSMARREIESGSEVQMDDGGVTRTFLFLHGQLASGESTLGHVVSLVDTTERKRAEALLARDLEALTRMHTLTTTTLETEDFGAAMQGIMDTAVTILGADAGTLQLLDEDTLRIVAHRGHRPEFLEFFASAENVGSVCGEAARRRERVIVTDVELSPLLAGTESMKVLRNANVRGVQSTPLISHAGQLLGVLTTQWACPHCPDEPDLRRLDLVVRLASDLVERKKAEEALRERERDLEAANGELESFSYSVSHDLRAPLRKLEGFSEILLEDYSERLDQTGKDYLNRIRTASQTMSLLIDDMLRLSRISRADLRLDAIDLSRVVREVASEIEAAEPDRCAEISVEPHVRVLGDRQLLRILIQNLLNNSWKYTVGCPAARIEFGAIRRDGQPVCFVRDNGTGFNMKYADKLFEPFQRLHSSRPFSGSGIGLAIARRVVERHGGEIWAEAEEGKGATFYFTLGTGSR